MRHVDVLNLYSASLLPYYPYRTENFKNELLTINTLTKDSCAAQMLPVVREGGEY